MLSGHAYLIDTNADQRRHQGARQGLSNLCEGGLVLGLKRLVWCSVSVSLACLTSAPHHQLVVNLSKIFQVLSWSD
jgi:hypothetical protein